MRTLALPHGRTPLNVYVRVTMREKSDRRSVLGPGEAEEDHEVGRSINHWPSESSTMHVAAVLVSSIWIRPMRGQARCTRVH